MLDDLLVLAIDVAEKAHADVLDAAGVPYIQHPLEIMRMLAFLNFPVEYLIVAILHDVVEDSKDRENADEHVSLDDLRAMGFPERIVLAVDALSRREYLDRKEVYMDLILRAALNALARVVKLFDNAHNSLPRRVVALDPDRAAFSAKRYKRARVRLLEAEREARAADPSLPALFPVEEEAFLSFVIALDERLRHADREKVNM